MHSLDDIMRASAAWLSFPSGCDQELIELQLVRYPERFGGGVKASQVASDLDPAAVLDHAITRTRAWGERTRTFWTNASDSPDLEAELRRRAATHTDTAAVLARPIDGIPSGFLRMSQPKWCARSIRCARWLHPPRRRTRLRADSLTSPVAAVSNAGVVPQAVPYSRSPASPSPGTM